MKTSLSSAAVVACLAIFAVSDLNAQAPPAGGALPTHRHGIAVFDVSKVYKNHTRFHQKMQTMKADVQRAETAMKAEADGIKRAAEALKEVVPGTADFKKKEEAITQSQADLQVKMQLLKKDFLEREAVLYKEVMKEINQEIAYYAEAKKLSLVLRYQSEPIEDNSQQNVMRELNKLVLYHANIDITDPILTEINRRSANAGNTPVGVRSAPGAPKTR